MQPSIELVSLDQVVNYFESAMGEGYRYFAVYQGKGNLKFQYSGDDVDGIGKNLLYQSLAVPAQNGTTAIYTLTFYSRLGKDEEIDKNSQVASVNFRLNDVPGSFMSQRSVGAVQDNTALNSAMERIKFLEAQLDERDDEPQQATGIGGIINGIAGNPEFQKELIGRLFTWLDRIAPAKASIGDVNFNAAISDQDKKIMEAVGRLKLIEPNLGDHLLKLADIATNNPIVFNQIIAALKTM